jgi:hypothetical protein
MDGIKKTLCATSPLGVACFSAMKSKFGAEGDVPAPDAMGASEEVAEAAGKVMSPTDWILYFLTIYTFVVSWSLNNNMAIRSTLGYNNKASIIVSILSIIGLMIIGPVWYIVFLMLPVMHNVFRTPNGMTWLEGIKYAPKNGNAAMGLIAKLPVLGGSDVKPMSASFGHYYF